MSFWGTRPHRLALLELLRTGEVRRRRRQRQAFDELLELGWARRTCRSGVLALDPECGMAVRATLDTVWPGWEAEAQRLEDRGYPLTPTGQRELERRDRLAGVDRSSLPGRMNRRTAAATVATNAKARLGPVEHIVLEDVDVTDDGIVRMKPSAGLSLVRAGIEHPADDLVELLGELAFTDRALRDGTRLGGHPPRAILTVENLGAFQDVRVPDDVLTVYVPGWNTRIARDLLSGLEETPILHFGDLDPNGVAILNHLRRWRPDLGWLIPDYWKEYADDRGLPKRWPDVSFPPESPSWVVSLAEAGVWLEQEVIVLDSRFLSSVEEAVDSASKIRTLRD